MECEAPENQAENAKHLQLHTLKTYECKFREDKHSVVLNLYNISSVNKILATEFMNEKVSLNLNSMQKMSTQ